MDVVLKNASCKTFDTQDKLPLFTSSYSKYNCYIYCGKEHEPHYNASSPLIDDKNKFKHSYLTW